MSAAGILFGLLGTGNATSWTPPSDPTGPPPGETIGGIPEPYDPVVAELRPPATPIQTYRVGPGKDYQAIEDAVEAARIRQSAIPAGENRWVHIIVDPGEYAPVNDGRLPAYPFQAFFSSSGEPNSVKIQGGWEYASAPFYIEGFHADARGTTGPKYGIHAGGGGPTGVMVMVGSTLIHSDKTIGSSWPMGTDGGGGGYWLLYDCTLVGKDSGARTNNHSGTGATSGFRMLYVQVTANCGIEFNGMGAGQADELWVVDTTATWAGLANSAGRLYSNSGLPVGAGPWAGATPEPLPGPWPRPAWT